MAVEKIEFTKMHGIGNDYIYIDCFKNKVDNPSYLAKIMSPRRTSVGSDGLILICPSEAADAKMRMFNLDGSEGKMCGNGIRCVGKYIYDTGLVKKKTLRIETLSGIKTLTVSDVDGKAESLTVDMGEPILKCNMIPVISDKQSLINEPVVIKNKGYNITTVSMGNPHAVLFCKDVKSLNLEKIGPEFENSSLFPESVNTEFIKIIDNNNLEMRVWERGSGETFACGTGACAAVVAAVLNGHCKKESPVSVHLKCGTLTITYANDSHIYMSGAAKKVYDGVFYYES